MKQLFSEYFILGLPYIMLTVFAVGAFFRVMIWYTVKRHESFATEFERRVAKYIENAIPGKEKNISFYVIAKKMLEKTYYEVFEMRDRMHRRRRDKMMSMSDRVFLIRQGCAWLIKDILKQLKFLRHNNETPKLLNITKATFHHNPSFNNVFGIFPIGILNDVISILPGLFVVAGILGTFIGIAKGLPALGGMNLQDVDSTKNVMDRFLFEISFAMTSSIVGIALSLTLNFINTWFNPDRVFMNMVDRFEASLDLLWYRSDNNEYPNDDIPFDENKDPSEALAEEALNKEISSANGKNDEDRRRYKAS